MAPIFSPISLSLPFLLLLSASPFSTARPQENNFSQTPTFEFPETQAKKFIRELNLFPKHDINIAAPGSSSSDYPRLVERKLTLPVIAHSGARVEELTQHAGYYRLPHSKDGRMFYFFFGSRRTKVDPVVIWLTGGPGCSSELALFYENGPFNLASNLTLIWNDFGWDKASNLIYVDQPIGTGFSYSSDEGDIRHDEGGVTTDLYDFLQEFFKAHPDYANNWFYIAGESYAGHYIPVFAARIHQGNKNKEGIYINLKGFAIGNGLTNPEIQYKAYTDYALDNRLIKKSDADNINKEFVPPCEQAIQNCGTYDEGACENAYSVCTKIFSNIVHLIGNKNYYDIRKNCKGPKNRCYDFSNMERFLNQESVKDALGVGNIEFLSCSSKVYKAMLTDWVKNHEVEIPELLEDGIQMLAYAGEYDLICNWFGISRWVDAMEWSGQKDFLAAPSVPFRVDRAEAGEMKTFGPLTFLKVHNAGHLVPMDQPKVSLEMLRRWTQGQLATAEEEGQPAPI